MVTLTFRQPEQRSSSESSDLWIVSRCRYFLQAITSRINRQTSNNIVSLLTNQDNDQHSNIYYVGSIGKVTHKPIKVTHHEPELNLVSVPLEATESIEHYSPLDRIPVHRRVTPSSRSPVPIYTPRWREWGKVSCLRKQHDGRDWPLNHRPSHLKSNALTTDTT